MRETGFGEGLFYRIDGLLTSVKVDPHLRHSDNVAIPEGAGGSCRRVESVSYARTEYYVRIPYLGSTRTGRSGCQKACRDRREPVWDFGRVEGRRSCEGRVRPLSLRPPWLTRLTGESGAAYGSGSFKEVGRRAYMVFES